GEGLKPVRDWAGIRIILAADSRNLRCIVISNQASRTRPPRVCYLRSKGAAEMFSLKRKALAFAATAGLMTAVFQPAGCNVSVDPQTGDAVLNWLQQNSGNLDFGGNFHFNHTGGGDTSGGDTSGDGSGDSGSNA